MFVCSVYFTLFVATPNIIVAATKNIIPPIRLDFKSFLVQKECLSETLWRYSRIVVIVRRYFFLFCSQIHSCQIQIHSHWIQKSLSSNGPDAEGYYENQRPKILPVDSASYIGGGQTNGTTKKHNRGTKNWRLWTGPKSHNLKDFLGRIGVGFEVGLEVGWPRNSKEWPQS